MVEQSISSGESSVDPEKTDDGTNSEDHSSEEGVTHLKSSRLDLRTYLAFAAMCVVDLTEAIDATSIAVVLPSIAQSLNSSTTATFSLATSFLLAATVFQPVFASLSEIFGRKPILLIALALFLAGAIIGALAENVAVLLGGRIVQGIGAAGTITLTVIVVTDIVSLRRRAPWFAVLNVMWTVGSVSGPVIGGALVQLTWRWILWINVPLVVTSIVGIVFFLRLVIPEGSFRSKLARLDYVGMTAFVVSATAFLLPISLAGTVYPWSSWRILLPLILGTVGLVAFVCHQKWMAKHPAIRLSIFSNRTAIICYVGTFIQGVLLWMLLYYLPLYYEGVRGYRPLIAGLAAFPETFTVAPAAIATGLTISKTGHYQWALVSGWVLTTLGMGLLCLLRERTPIIVWVVVNLVPGLGLGVLIPAASTAIQAATKGKDAAYSISMFYLLRCAGQTVGVAVGGTVFRYQLGDILKVGDVAPESTVEELLKILRSLRGRSEGEELKQGIVKALMTVWGVGCALAGVAGISSFWMKTYSLDRDCKEEQKEERGTVESSGAK